MVSTPHIVGRQRTWFLQSSAVVRPIRSGSCCRRPPVGSTPANGPDDESVRDPDNLRRLRTPRGSPPIRVLPCQASRGQLAHIERSVKLLRAPISAFTLLSLKTGAFE